MALGLPQMFCGTFYRMVPRCSAVAFSVCQVGDETAAVKNWDSMGTQEEEEIITLR